MNTPEPLPIVRACQLAQQPPEQQWLVESLWGRDGVGVIGGTPKSLKTWLGLELAVSVASGTPCLGHYAVRSQGAALVYPAEDTLGAVKDRLETLCAGRGVDLETLDVFVITAPTLRLDHPVDCQRLEQTVKDINPRLLVLDPLVRLHGADENHAQEIAAILSRLSALSRRYHTAIALVHHTRKDGRAKQAGQNLRGSGELHAWGSSNLYLSHEKNRLKLTIEHRAAPTPEPVYMALKDSPLRLVLDNAPLSSPPTLETRILNALSKRSHPITRTELRALLAVNNSRLGDALTKLQRLGRISKQTDGWIL